MKKLNKNNGLLLVGMLVISFSNKPAGHGDGVVEAPRLADGDGQSGRVNKEPRNLNWFQMSLRNLREKLSSKSPSKPAPASSSTGVAPAQQLRTTTGVDSTGVLDKTTLTKQDKAAIEKAGKGGFFSFFHPKPKTEVAKKVVVEKARLVEKFSPIEKQVFNEVLVQRPAKEETQVQYVARMEAIALAERMVMDQLVGLRRGQLDGYGRNYPDTYFKKAIFSGSKAVTNGVKIKDELVHGDIGNVDRELFTQELDKVLTVLFPAGHNTTQYASKTLKPFLDQAGDKALAAWRKTSGNSLLDSLNESTEA